MNLRLAIAGLRHNHIIGLVRLARQMPDIEIVAAAEDDEPTRQAMAEHVKITHTDVLRMIHEVDCDIVAVGDYYSRHGSLTIEALKRGRHVISDKPLATSLAEVEEIAVLVGHSGLSVGCQLDLTESPNLVRLRELIRSGALGDVHQIVFGGQHPLLYGKRASWYFEPGKHGGTINDIGVHAIHVIPWLTGLDITEVVAARTWNAYAKEVPHFNDSAQFMLKLSNDGGVLGDVSYAMPDALGYQLPQYWRFTVFGSQGLAETSYGAPDVMYAHRDASEVMRLPGLPPDEPGYFQSFLHEIRGQKMMAALTTDRVLEIAKRTLKIQALADRTKTGS